MCVCVAQYHSHIKIKLFPTSLSGLSLHMVSLEEICLEEIQEKNIFSRFLFHPIVNVVIGSMKYGHASVSNMSR